MRIVIEHDTAPTTGPVTPAAAAAAPAEAENAGAPQSAGVETTSGADAGGPPQWLLEAVGRAMAADNAAADTMTDAVDGGAAPNDPQAATKLPAGRGPRDRKP